MLKCIAVCTADIQYVSAVKIHNLKYILYNFLAIDTNVSSISHYNYSSFIEALCIENALLLHLIKIAIKHVISFQYLITKINSIQFKNNKQKLQIHLLNTYFTRWIFLPTQ